MLAAPRVLAAALKGDDALLRSLVDMFEREGLRVVGAADAAPDLIAKAGVMGRIKPNAEHEADIAQAHKIARVIGALDIGQAAIVCAGLPLAVEAAEGTDAMIARVPALPEHFRGSAGKRRGVLVKAPKPIQVTAKPICRSLASRPSATSRAFIWPVSPWKPAAR